MKYRHIGIQFFDFSVIDTSQPGKMLASYCFQILRTHCIFNVLLSPNNEKMSRIENTIHDIALYLSTKISNMFY